MTTHELLILGAQVYAALALSWLILKVWKVGQAIGRVSNPGEHHYTGLPDATAAKRKASDEKLKALLDEAVDFGAPIRLVVLVITFIVVAFGAVASIAWPYWLLKALKSNQSKGS